MQRHLLDLLAVLLTFGWCAEAFASDIRTFPTRLTLWPEENISAITVRN